MNPLQTQLLMIDAYRLIAEVIPDLDGVIIDGGANVGQATEHLRKCFPSTPIHAFEPVGEAFEQLAEHTAPLGVRPHRRAPRRPVIVRGGDDDVANAAGERFLAAGLPGASVSPTPMPAPARTPLAKW